MLNNKIIFCFIIFLFNFIKLNSSLETVLITELILLLGSKDCLKSLQKQIEPKNLIKNFITQYTNNATVTFFHELGHAVTARLINKQQFTIYLGSYNTEKEPIIDLGLIKIVGFNPAIGITKFNINKNNKNLNNNIVLLAGGLSGIIGNYLVKIILKKDQNFIIDNIFMQQVLTMLWPNKLQNDNLSDGGKLWQNGLKIDKEVIDLACKMAPAINFLLFLFINSKNSKNLACHSFNTSDTLLLTLLNYQLNGYLFFSPC